ncbi:MAG TPA: DUF3179 domain-containing (seleno)protein [Pirellulaceae bacterium]|nr:DUF3179 domain-containing (seleno)protein [Pirellulaceae bacterium]
MGRVSWALVLLPLAGCVAVCLWIGSMPSAPSTPAGKQVPKVDVARPPTRHMPLRLDVPAIENPPLEYADEVGLDDEAIVIGIVVNGEPRAYLREAFDTSPNFHVVTDTIDSTPVAITHCDRLRCTRVFTGPQLEEPGSIRGGGWRVDQTLALIVDEQEYSQKSPEIPLDEVPFLELPWGMWRELFPDTLVYVGQSGAG